jgi:hypothetical protein
VPQGSTWRSAPIRPASGAGTAAWANVRECHPTRWLYPLLSAIRGSTMSRHLCPHRPCPGPNGRRDGSRKRSRLSLPTSVPTSGFASWLVLPRRPSREPLSRVTSIWSTRLPRSSTTEAAGPTSFRGRYSKAQFYGSSSSDRDGVPSCSSLIRTGTLKLAASQAPPSGFSQTSRFSPAPAFRNAP